MSCPHNALTVHNLMPFEAYPFGYGFWYSYQPLFLVLIKKSVTMFFFYLDTGFGPSDIVNHFMNRAH